jgi:DNA-binding response OmpR family regulator
MRNKTVLVIDDEQGVLAVIKKRLEIEGYKVITAANGNSGFDLALKSKPSLILLDIMLPDMDGLEVLRKIKSKNDIASVPVIMLTAKGESKTMFEAQDLGAVDYIIKPYDLKELLELVAKYV